MGSIWKDSKFSFEKKKSYLRYCSYQVSSSCIYGNFATRQTSRQTIPILLPSYFDESNKITLYLFGVIIRAIENCIMCTGL